MTRVLVIDNYDSFTYNLVQYLGELGAELDVVRNDATEAGALLERAPDRVVVSPGPCTPAEAGVSVEAIRGFAEAGMPVLGVCLGHQALAAAFGGSVVRGEPVHGKTARRSSTTAGRSSAGSSPRSWPAATTRWSWTPPARTASSAPRWPATW